MAVKNLSLLCVITLSQLYGVFAYPYGAPTQACEGMSPDHGFQPQTVESRFRIRPSAVVYCPKNEINVTLYGEVPFRGFICQARPSVNGFETSGSLTSSETDAGRTTTNCGDKASLTHKDGNRKNSVSFTWTPDSSKTDKIYIVCTTVEKKSTYWVKQNIQIKYAGSDKCTPEGEARGLPTSCNDSTTCDMQFTSSVCDTTADADGQCVCPSNMTVAHPMHTFCSPKGLPTSCSDSTSCDMYFAWSICDTDADADGQCVCPSNMEVADPSHTYCSAKANNDACTMDSDCAGVTDSVCIGGQCKVNGASSIAFSLIALVVCGLLFYSINA